MSKLILFEGTDGSGKTTLINNFKNYLTEKNRSCQIIDKSSDATAKSITLVYNKAELNNLTEIYLRIAREFSKITAIDKSCDYIIIDRAIISLISTINIYGFKTAEFDNAISQLIKSYGNFSTVFCCPPYEIARKRIEERSIMTNVPLSKKEQKGFEYNKEIYDNLVSLSQNEKITGYQTLVINSHLNNEEQCLNQLIEFFKE
jgi:thymidylate kinase